MLTMTTTAAAPFAVRVLVEHEDGTIERTYVRPRNSRMGRQAFAAFALGDLLLLTEVQAITKIDVAPCDVPFFAPTC